MKTTRKLTISAMAIALYVVTMFFTQGFAFGAYQIRIATSLYGLTAIYPFLLIPMGIANFLSNTIMGGLGILDMVGGVIVGIVTCGVIYLIKKFNLNEWFIALPVLFVPGLLVPIWLSYILHIPYTALAVSLCIGQIVPAIFAVILVKTIKIALKKN